MNRGIGESWNSGIDNPGNRQISAPAFLNCQIPKSPTVYLSRQFLTSNRIKSKNAFDTNGPGVLPCLYSREDALRPAQDRQSREEIVTQEEANGYK